MSFQAEMGKCTVDLGELRDANGLLDDVPALKRRMDEDGYLLIRGLHPRERVHAARKAVFEFCAAESDMIMPGTDPADGIINPGYTKPAHTMGRGQVTHHPDVRSVLEGKPIFDFFTRYFDQPVRTFDYKWLRAVEKEQSTGAHIDIVYMGRGSTKNLFTCWTPMGDIPVEQGTLCLCLGSHNLPGFQKIRDTYGKMDVDRDRVSGGWFSDNPNEITAKFGGEWQTTNFRAGDVLIFGMWTMHGSTRNKTDRWRLSCDTRFQPAADPVDERWVGENPIARLKESEKVVTMDMAREKWGI
ncbi:MAG: phytanoyl-CoA dioxygenase family protein [Tepidisphaeraceae bacterium]